MWYMHNSEIVLSLAEEGHADTSCNMNLEDIVLSEISQSQKDKYCIITLTHGISNIQTYRSRE